jgi:hypothetical protein
MNENTNAVEQTATTDVSTGTEEKTIDTVEGLNELLEKQENGTKENNVSELAAPNTASESTNEPEAESKETSETEDTDNISSLPKSKQASAFAKMRIQNTKQQHALKAILQRAGLDATLANDPDKLLELLEDADVTKQAEQLKVPPQLLKRLNYLEKVTREAESEKLYAAAAQGFQLVKDKYNLTDEQLVQFATQLKEDGINPFEQPVNLVNEYILRNLDNIITNAQEQAVQQALAQQNKAVQYSSTPNRTQGAATSPQLESKINTQAAFDKFLASLLK